MTDFPSGKRGNYTLTSFVKTRNETSVVISVTSSVKITDWDGWSAQTYYTLSCNPPSRTSRSLSNDGTSRVEDFTILSASSSAFNCTIELNPTGSTADLITVSQAVPAYSPPATPFNPPVWKQFVATDVNNAGSSMQIGWEVDKSNNTKKQIKIGLYYSLTYSSTTRPNCLVKYTVSCNGKADVVAECGYSLGDTKYLYIQGFDDTYTDRTLTIKNHMEYQTDSSQASLTPVAETSFTYTLSAITRPVAPDMNDSNTFKYVSGSLALPYVLGCSSCKYVLTVTGTEPVSSAVDKEHTVTGSSYSPVSISDSPTVFGLSKNCAYSIVIKSIEYFYTYMGVADSGTATNTATTKLSVAWAKEPTTVAELEAALIFGYVADGNTQYGIICSLASGIYSSFNTGDKISCYVSRNGSVIESFVDIAITSTSTFYEKFAESIGDMQTGSNLYEMSFKYYKKIGATSFAETVATASFSITRSFFGIPPLSLPTTIKIDSNKTWNLTISNNSTDVTYTQSSISVVFTRYLMYVPKLAKSGDIPYIDTVTNQSPSSEKFGPFPYSSANSKTIPLYQPISTTNTDATKPMFPASTSKIFYKLYYYDSANENVGISSETSIDVTPYIESSFQKVDIAANTDNTPLLMVISEANNLESTKSLANVYAGTVYNLRAIGQATITIPITFDKDSTYKSIISTIAEDTTIQVRKIATGSLTNLDTMFNFGNGGDLTLIIPFQTFVTSKIVNGFYITSLLYDTTKSYLVLKGNYCIYYEGITARYNASDFPSYFNYPILKGETQKRVITMVPPTLIPNKNLSKPWDRPSGNAILKYNQKSPAIKVYWANPTYPGISTDTNYGYVNETAIKVKREHKLANGSWVVDKLFGDNSDSDWKTLAIGSTSVEDFLYGEESLTNTTKYESQYDKVNATLYRTYRYTICGYNDIASGLGDNRFSDPLVTAEVTATSQVRSVDIKTLIAKANNLNQVIKIEWTTDDENTTSGQYPAMYYKIMTKSYLEDNTWIMLNNKVTNTYYIHRANPGVPHYYRVIPYSLYPGASKETTGEPAVYLDVTDTNKKMALPFKFSKDAVTNIIRVANRTFYLSDMDRAVVSCNNKVYKAGIKRPKFTITVTPSEYVSDVTTGSRTLQAGKYEAYVVLVRKDTETRSNASDPVAFIIGNKQNKIVFTAPFDAYDRIPIRDKAYTIYGAEILAADYWEVYIKCLDNDSFGQPVCVGTANTVTNVITISNLTDDDILSASNRRLPITEPYSIAPCCSVGEFYNNRLYLTGENPFFSCEHFNVSNGSHVATIGEIVPEGIVGKQIYVDNDATGWSVSDIEYSDGTTTIDISHFNINTDEGGWDRLNIDSSSGNKVTFKTSSSRVYYSAYFFGEPDGVTYTFSPETFPPLNVLESELSSNDFSSPIALVKSRDSLFVGKRDKMIAITGGNTDDNTYIVNTTINILSNTLGVLGRRTIARDDQDNVYCLSDHGLVIINTSGVNLINYIGNTKSSFRLLFDLSDIKNACAVWSPRDQYYIVFGLKFKGESSRTAGLIYDNYVQQVRPFSLPVEVTSAMVCPAENGEYQIVIADSTGCIGTFLDRKLAHDLVFDWSNSTYKKSAINGNITTGVYKPSYGLTLGPYLYPGFRPSLPEIDEANSSSFVRPQSVTVGFDLLGRTNYFNQFHPEVDTSVDFSIPMASTSRRVAIKQMTGQALSIRVDFEVMDNHLDFGSASVDVNEETY